MREICSMSYGVLTPFETERPMPTASTLPDFDQIADMYWRLGVMQSPSQLQGFLIGQLVVGDDLTAPKWPEQAAGYIDAVESPNEQENSLLHDLFTITEQQLLSDEMALVVLLPDDDTDIGQRVDSIGQWCQGFLAGFALAGKTKQRQQGQQQYSKDVSEALTDFAAISQISLGDEDEDMQHHDQELFEISEYLRLAAITIYLDCRQGADEVTSAPSAGSQGHVDQGNNAPADDIELGGGAAATNVATTEQGAITSPNSLFKPRNKLH